MKHCKILIIEDHSLTRFGLRTAFESCNLNEDNEYEYEVFESATAQKGIEIADKEEIDLIVMDLGLPDMSGIEATQIIKKSHPHTKIVILSSHEQEEEVISSLKAGAGSYCTKDIEPDKLIEIVNSVLNGTALFSPKVARYVLNAAANNFEAHLEQKKDEVSEEIVLTSREIQVLKLIVDGMTNSEIAKKLNISVNTTKVHVCNLLQKLGVQDRTQAAIKAMKDKLI